MLKWLFKSVSTGKGKGGEGSRGAFASSAPYVGRDEVIQTSRFLVELAPENIPFVIGRFRKQAVTMGLDGYVYLNEVRLGLLPLEGCDAEYWLLRDTRDPQNEWQIWYHIPRNIYGLAETSLSAIIHYSFIEELGHHLEFVLSPTD